VNLHPDNDSARKQRNIINLNSFSHARQELEKALIINALARHNGNITQTAKAIEYDKYNLTKKMKKYGIRPLIRAFRGKNTTGRDLLLSG
jgi:transcriptional regulator with GAF, ATPase, and Fis domain